MNKSKTKKKAESLLHKPDLVKRFVRVVQSEGVSGEDVAIKSLLLIGVSRKLEQPLHAIVKGSSSSGKSFIVNKVLTFFSPEEVMVVNDLTPRALQNMEGLSGKVVVIAEAEGATPADHPLRAAMSEGKVSVLVPERKGTGTFRTTRREVDARAAFIITSTRTKLYDETETRSLQVILDDNAEQVRRIIRDQATREGRPPSNGGSARSEALRDVWRVALGLIEPFQVRIPQGTQLQKTVLGLVQRRRDFPLLLGLIQASTLLHQRQRRRDEKGCLLAQTEDVKVAQEIGDSLFQSLPPSLANAVGTLRANCREEFHASEAAKHLGTSIDSARHLLMELEKRKVAYKSQAGTGQMRTLWSLRGGLVVHESRPVIRRRGRNGFGAEAP